MFVDLQPRVFWGDVELTASPYGLVFGADYGSPETIREILETELFDGSVVSSSRQDNREPTFQIAILDEVDIAGMELAGKRLEDEALKERNTLRYEPGFFGTPWVLETYRADLAFERSDDRERAMVRIYTVTMPAHPHLRTVEPVTIPAIGNGTPTPPPPPVESTIWSSGSGTAGWEAWADAVVTPSMYGGSVYAMTTQLVSRPTQFVLAYASGFGTGSHGLLGIKTSLLGSGEGEVQVQVSYGGSPVSLSRVSAQNGWSYYPIRSGAYIDRVLIAGTVKPYQPSPMVLGLGCGGIKLRSGFPHSGTARQLTRSFEVHGTARTSGTLRLSHANALGSVLAWSGADTGHGVVPALKSGRTAGDAENSDSDAASGSYSLISVAATIMERPASQFSPGLHLLVARLKSSGVGKATITATTRLLPSSPVPTASVTTATEVSLGGASGYTFHPLGTVSLGGTQSEGYFHRFSIHANGLTGTMTSVWFDDLYALNISTGAVTIINSGTGKRLFINAPTVDAPFPSIFASTLADDSDVRQVDSLAQIWQPAAWTPGTTTLFTVCGVLNVAAEAEYYPRFLHNAYPIEAP